MKAFSPVLYSKNLKALARITRMNQLPSEFGNKEHDFERDDSVYERWLRNDDLEGNHCDGDGDGDSDSDSDDDDDDELPITHQFKLSGTKSITCLKYHPSGSELYTATTDGSLLCYNFNSMSTESTEPSHSFEPFESHHIHKLDIASPRGPLLTLANTSTFKLISLEGDELASSATGDRYLYDVKQTRGHTDTITDGGFISNEKVITSSLDSTFRIWDTTKCSQQSVTVVKANGKKTKVSHLEYSSAGLAFAVNDNRLTSWDINTKMMRPIEEFVEKCTILSIKSSEDKLLVRTHDSIKLYDVKNLSRPLIQRLSYPSPADSSFTSPMYFNNDKIVIATSNSIDILDKSDLMTISCIKAQHNVSCAEWEPKTNQIAYGQYLEGSKGYVSILFDPKLSRNGVMATINNRPKKRHLDDSIFTSKVKEIGYNMDELNELKKSKKKKNDVDEDRSKKNTLVWGRTQPSERNIDEDPREALKKYSK